MHDDCECTNPNMRMPACVYKSGENISPYIQIQHSFIFHKTFFSISLRLHILCYYLSASTKKKYENGKITEHRKWWNDGTRKHAKFEVVAHIVRT